MVTQSYEVNIHMITEKDSKEETDKNNNISIKDEESVIISTKEILKKLHDVALSFALKKNPNIQIEDKVIPELSNSERIIYMLIAKAKDSNKIPDKSLFVDVIKEYIKYYIGENISKTIEDDLILELMGQDDTQNGELNGDLNSQLKNESFVIKNSIVDLLFEAADDDGEDNNDDETDQQNNTNNDQLTNGNRDKLLGYYIGYAITNSGLEIKDLDSTFSVKTNGLFGSTLSDLRSMSITTRYGNKLNIGKLLDPDEWKNALGNPDVDIDQIKSDLTSVLRKDLPNNQSDVRVYRSEEILDILKKNGLINNDKSKKFSNKINSDDVARILKVTYCLAIEVMENDPVFDRWNKSLVATEATKAFGSHHKLRDGNKITEKDVILLEDFISDWKIKDWKVSRKKNTTSTTSNQKNETLLYICPADKLLIESFFGLDETEENDNVENVKHAKSDDEIIKILKDQFSRALNKFRLKIEECIMSNPSDITEKFKDYTLKGNSVLDSINEYSNVVCITCSSDGKIISESVNDLVDTLTNLIIEAEDEDDDVSVDDIKQWLKSWIMTMFKNDDISQFFNGNSNPNHEVYITTATTKLEQEQIDESLILEGHSPEYNKVMAKIDSMTDNDFTTDFINKYKELYKKHIGDLKKKFEDGNPPANLSGGQKQEDFKNLISKDYMSPDSTNPMLKNVIKHAKGGVTKDMFKSDFEKYFGSGTKKDGSQERIELYALALTLGLDPDELPQEENKYRVRFFDVDPKDPEDKNGHKQIGDDQNVTKAEDLSYPDENKLDTHEGYGFTGWSMTKDDIINAGGLSEDTDIFAQYDSISSGMRRVSFVYIDPRTDKELSVGEITYVSSVDDLKNIEYPDDKIPNMKSEGFVFDVWEPSKEDIQKMDSLDSDIKIVGRYKEVEDGDDTTTETITIILWPNDKKSDTEPKDKDGEGEYIHTGRRLFLIPKKNLTHKNEKKTDREMQDGNFMSTKSVDLYSTSK